MIIPAFGLPKTDFDCLLSLGCTLVDTTCGSVLNVWKNVDRYGKNGFTSVIHGKHDHEETIATASQATAVGGQFLVLRDMSEAEDVARFIEGRASVEQISERHKGIKGVASPGFVAERDLARIGLANQTTMLSSESLDIEKRLRVAMESRYGADTLEAHFRAFDTICSATQERQDAVVAMCEDRIDTMLVIGGYNSSNTGHLVEIAGESSAAYHIEDSTSLVSADELTHQPHGKTTTTVARSWLPDGPLTVGLTSGASTPNNRVGEVLERLLELRGIPIDEEWFAAD